MHGTERGGAFCSRPQFVSTVRITEKESAPILTNLDTPLMAIKKKKRNISFNNN